MTDKELQRIVDLAEEIKLKLTPRIVDGEPAVTYLDVETTSYRRAYHDAIVFWAQTYQPGMMGVRP